MRALFMVILVLMASCATSVPERPPALVDTSAVEARYREGAAAVATYLAQRGENPRDYFLSKVESGSDEQVAFHVVHARSFARENRNIDGNPSGKDGVVYYDTRNRRVTQMLFFQ